MKFLPNFREPIIEGDRMRVLILQNCEYETLGSYERYLMQNYLTLIRADDTFSTGNKVNDQD